ncbi:MAG: RNase adapter RapZ [Clostridia bacterium]|nr:RNase adapter RapZ [Clostridia bacterium]
MELVIITGMSGAGKSCVVNSLEDVGFFCVDNLPAKLIPVFADLLKCSKEHDRVAVVTDVRAGESFSELFDALDELNERQIEYKLMFIDASDDVLLNRFKETRRKHPLVQGTYDSVENAIARERKMLSKAKANADFLLETSNLSAIQCRVRVASMFSGSGDKSMHIHCMSFGFKHGIPNDADFVFDVRFLPNPFYIPELKHLTGLDKAVSDYVMSFDESKDFEKKLISLLDCSLPLCVKEGRSQLIIAVGCTGGHHRSVTFAEILYNHFREKGFSSSVSHRDILK